VHAFTAESNLDELLLTRQEINGPEATARYAANTSDRRRRSCAIRSEARDRHPWEGLPTGTDLLFYEGLHGAVVTEKVDVAQHADLLIGVVPVIDLEWT